MLFSSLLLTAEEFFKVHTMHVRRSACLGDEQAFTTLQHHRSVKYVLDRSRTHALLNSLMPLVPNPAIRTRVKNPGVRTLD
jgi:hypothetical protein